MKFSTPKNENYAATITTIRNIIKLDNCDNVQATSIFGNQIIIGKNININYIGVYFPAEAALSEQFLHNNNLYRDNTKNKDQSKKGYFESNGRIRALTFRGHQSCGLFLELSCFDFISTHLGKEFKIGDVFDEINNIPICQKYEIRTKTKKSEVKPKGKKQKRISKLIDNQFRFHESTAHFAKNMHNFKPTDIISITKKLHGTSVVIANVLCKKKLTLFQKILSKFTTIQDKDYDNVYSSRTVVKNSNLNGLGFYNEDVWGTINEKYKHLLPKGITIYGEIVGFTKSNGYIQKGYDYGCKPYQSELYIYRITYTNIDGDVFEFSAKQVQSFCNERQIKHVPELFYGKIEEYLNDTYKDREEFQEKLLEKLKQDYLEVDCSLCKNKVPDEGIVVRKESSTLQAYKLKSFRFIKKETEDLDNGIISIEEAEDELEEAV